MSWNKGAQYGAFLETLYTIFVGLSADDQEEILRNLNKIKISSRVDIELKKMYDEEFEEVYGDLGEEDAIEEIKELTKNSDLGSIERLKYLTLWYNTRVKSGLYEGYSS